MKTSSAGVAAIAFYEGLRTDAYRDSVGVWTIGVGHTAAAGPPKPAAGMRITAQQALDILATDLPKYEAPVNKRMPNVPQHVFDAAVSFCFNVGQGNFASASWPTKYLAGNMAAAEAALKQWNKASGRVIAGLTTRRGEEADMIFRNVYPNHIKSPDFVGGRKPDVPDDEPAADEQTPATPEIPVMVAATPMPPIASVPAAAVASPFGDLVHLLGSTGLNVLMQSNPALAVVGNLVKNALDKPNVAIEVKDVPGAAAEVLSAIKADPKVAVVPVKSAFQSKINWLNGAFMTAVAGYVGFNIPTTPEGWAAAAGSIIVPALTILLKSFFSNSVTAASAGK